MAENVESLIIYLHCYCYVPHASCTWKWNLIQKLWFVQSFKNGFVQREMHFVQRYFIVDEEFMFTWLHPLITTDLILPDRTPVSYWWNTAEICSGEAFIQLWVHHLVTRRFIMILHFTISSHVYPRISPKLPLILWPCVKYWEDINQRNIEVLPNSSSVKGLTFFFIEGLRGILGRRRVVLCPFSFIQIL